jgi:hypothetical protein
MAEPLPPAGKVLKITHHFTIGTDSRAIVRLFWQYTGGPPNATALKGIAEAIKTAWEAKCKAICSNSAKLTGVEVLDLSSLEGARFLLAMSATGGAGGMGGASSALLQNYTIPRRYRGGKPRSYWPYLPSAKIEAPQAVEPAWIAECNTKLGEYFSSLAAISVEGTTLTTHCNVSYFHGFTNVPYGSPTKYRRVPTPRATPVVDTISAASVNGVPGSQRRRYARRA